MFWLVCVLIFAIYLSFLLKTFTFFGVFTRATLADIFLAISTMRPSSVITQHGGREPKLLFLINIYVLEPRQTRVWC